MSSELEAGGRERREARRSLPWVAGLLATIAIAALLPLLTAPRYYFNDDTQIGAYGIWFRLGELLREGGIPLIEPSTWMAGNVWVEGQWGVLNPVILAIGWFATLAPDAVVFATVVKIVFLCGTGAGVWMLARAYDVQRPWAYLAAVSVPLAGFTFYVDATTWVTGLFTFCFVAWSWWAARIVVIRAASPVWLLVFGYLVITVGYVHGTIALVFVLVATLADALFAREVRRALVVLAAGALLGCIALVVFLPAVLSADVTVRSGTGIVNDGFLVADVNGLLAGSISISRPEVAAWWGPFATTPMLYVSWALPLLAFVDLGRARVALREMRGLLGFLLVMVLWVSGPSYVGPLRIPVRMMPYVALALMMVLVVLLSRAAATSGFRARYAGLTLLALVGGYYAFAQVPASALSIAASVVVCLAGGALIPLSSAVARRRGQVPGVLVLFIMVTGATLVTSLMQHRAMPDPPLQDFQMPPQVAAYQEPLRVAAGDVFVAGEPTRSPIPAIWSETLLANMWYLNDRPVQNVYTPIGHAVYATKFCVNNRGETCAASLDAMFEVEPESGRTFADLMAVSTVQLVRAAFPEGALPGPPAGWHVADDGAATQTWVRDQVLPGAGGVTWASDGVEYSVISATRDRVELRLDSVPDDGGKIILSRLAWPGYEAEGAALADPTAGYLVTLDVDADSSRDVAVQFRPPGWALNRILLSIAAVGGMALVVLHALASRTARTGVRRATGYPVDSRLTQTVPAEE